MDVCTHLILYFPSVLIGWSKGMFYIVVYDDDANFLAYLYENTNTLHVLFLTTLLCSLGGSRRRLPIRYDVLWLNMKYVT